MSIDTQRVAVIGAGTMGAGIAGVFAHAGYDVALYSRSEATLDLAKDGLREVADRVRFSVRLDACLADAAIVSENVAEDAALKRALFTEIEARVPATCLLTTNTSSVPIGTIAGGLKQPERLVGLHWFNPPAVMPLIEIVCGPQTSEEAVARARVLCGAIGKDAITVRAEVPGFVINRLQYAMLREALHLVEEGVASVADIDRAVETTLAPRWSSAGPLRLMDLAGLDTVAKVCAMLMPALSRSPDVPPLLARLTAEGACGVKSGRGFYDWTPEGAAAAKCERDAVVRLLTQRRRA